MPKPSREQEYYDVLKILASYESPETLRRKSSERSYGLRPEEVIEMAYENMIESAKATIKGRKRPNI